MSDFDQLEAAEANRPGGSGEGSKVDIDFENLPEVDLADGRVGARLRGLIETGEDPKGEKQYPTRSEALFSAVGGMVKAGLSDGEIAAVITDKRYKVAESVTEHRGADLRRYVVRQIERARKKIGAKPTADDVRRFAEEGNATDPGSYASTLVSMIADAGVSIVKAAPILTTAAKNKGVGITDLRTLLRQRTKTDGDEKPSSADVMLGIVDEADLWFDQDGIAFASFERDGHRENVRAESKRFRDWLTWRFHSVTEKAPGGDLLKNAVNNASARAIFGGEQRRSWIRVAEHGGSLFLDLGDDDWFVIEIDAAGWRVVKNPSVRFRRGGGKALPMPVAGGKIDDLWQFINIDDERDRMLVLGWLVACLRPSRPFVILDIAGETGAAKTTTMRVLKALVDPSVAEARGLPKDEDDLLVSANNSWVVSADNVSRIDRDMGDALCRLATGGGIGKRQLYSDGDEFVLNALRPVVLTGLSLASQAQDLMSRMILVRLPNLPEGRRKTEATFWEAFKEARPTILGALLDAVSTALRRLPEVKIESAPRMADFATWAEAAGPAFGWKPGEFIEGYREACGRLYTNAADADLLSQVIIEYLKTAEDGAIEGTATELLDMLDTHLFKDRRRDAKTWPKTPSWFGRRLREIAPGLRMAGVEVEESEDQETRKSVYTLRLAKGPAPRAPETLFNDDDIPF